MTTHVQRLMRAREIGCTGRPCPMRFIEGTRAYTEWKLGREEWIKARAAMFSARLREEDAGAAMAGDRWE